MRVRSAAGNPFCRLATWLPIESSRLELQLVVRGNKVRGRFKTPGGDWRDVGECDLPTPPAGKPPRISLQFYNGLPDMEHWAKVSEVRILAAD